MTDVEDDEGRAAHGRSEHRGGKESSRLWDKSRHVRSCISEGEGGGQV